MFSPALAKPVIVVAKSIPAVTSAANINSSRVPAATGIASPVFIPLLTVPIETGPLSGGDKLTNAPLTGVNKLFGAVDSYSCAVKVIVVPINDNPTVVLKHAARDVIIPSLGIEKAIFAIVVVSIVSPMTLIPDTLLPNPMALVVPIKAPTTVVKTLG
jgi:hypothetical protein